nr:hypothetical protein GCM10020093_070870 [Planobispora longispora]
MFQMIKEAYYPGVSAKDWAVRVNAAVRDVRLDPDQVLGRYPHQLSGGQLQRLLIARALLLDLKLLIADEITSMLDASTRIDVLNLLAELKERGLGVLYVTHDLSLGTYLAERTVVLRHGRVVEMGRPTRSSATPAPLHAAAAGRRPAPARLLGGGRAGDGLSLSPGRGVRRAVRGGGGALRGVRPARKLPRVTVVRRRHRKESTS